MYDHKVTKHTNDNHLENKATKTRSTVYEIKCMITRMHKEIVFWQNDIAHAMKLRTLCPFHPPSLEPYRTLRSQDPADSTSDLTLSQR